MTDQNSNKDSAAFAWRNVQTYKVGRWKKELPKRAEVLTESGTLKANLSNERGIVDILRKTVALINVSGPSSRSAKRFLIVLICQSTKPQLS
jgi:hypothetical protein